MNILSIIFVSIASFANATNFGGAMHGRKMAVSYKSTSVGEHILVVKERVGIENKKAKFRQSQVVSLNLKRGESLSSYNGFQCRTDNDGFVYGVILKGKTKEHEAFLPERAWLVDEKKFNLNPIDVSTVKCRWSPDGEITYENK